MSSRWKKKYVKTRKDCKCEEEKLRERGEHAICHISASRFGFGDDRQGKRKREVFHSRRTMRVKVTSKVIPASFQKTEGSWPFVRAKVGRKGQLVELGGGQSPSSETLSWSKRRRNKGDLRKEATAGGAMEKGRSIH